ncbi:MAG: F0F1 ATP synthase subunit A [Alphaproteobacteria bacterium]|nr:F0F1 ATP synthase subunit A [Alphaproteobacteria bacterium]
MQSSPLGAEFALHIGRISISGTVLTTWAIMAVLVLGAIYLTRNLSIRPSKRQALIETLVTGIGQQIEDATRRKPALLLPLIGTLFIFLAVANLSSVVPGLVAPTARLETPAALTAIVFLASHYFGVRAQGVLGYLASFAKPKLIMLPLNILSQITRSFSLMVRLFGNVMSGEFMIGLVLALAGLFVPIPFMALEILLGLIQAYIFAVLATVFIGAAMGSVES